MNKENQLLKSLDKLFGFEYIKSSSVKKLKQYFDEKRNEHVFINEYRVIKGSKEQQKKDERERRKYSQFKAGKLLQSINAESGGNPQGQWLRSGLPLILTIFHEYH